MLLKKLRQRQEEAGLSDTAFAKQLGISQQLWNAIRLGTRQIIRPPLLTGILRAYPELNRDVLIFLSNGVEVSTITVDNPPKRHQRHQNGKLRRFRGWLRELLGKFLYTDISIGDKHQNGK